MLFKVIKNVCLIKADHGIMVQIPWDEMVFQNRIQTCGLVVWFLIKCSFSHTNTFENLLIFTERKKKRFMLPRGQSNVFKWQLLKRISCSFRMGML